MYLFYLSIMFEFGLVQKLTINVIKVYGNICLRCDRIFRPLVKNKTFRHLVCSIYIEKYATHLQIQKWLYKNTS